MRQAADANVYFVDRIEFCRAVHREYRNHSRREAAVGNYVYSHSLCFGVESKLLIDDVIVAAEVAEIAAGLDRGLARDVLP